MSRICGDPKFKILISVEKINLPFKREKKKKQPQIKQKNKTYSKLYENIHHLAFLSILYL